MRYNNISTSLFLWHCCTTCNLHSASAYLYIMQIKTVPHSSEDICWCLHLAIAVVTKDFYLGIHISNLKMWNFSPFFIKNNICEIQWCQSDLKSGETLVVDFVPKFFYGPWLFMPVMEAREILPAIFKIVDYGSVRAINSQ